jgi:hypothetical protein
MMQDQIFTDLDQDAGYIRLLEKKCSPPNPFADRKKPGQIGIDQSPISTRLKHIRPLKLENDGCHVLNSE